MIARFDKGEVSLTTSIGEIGSEFCFRVMSGDATSSELPSKVNL